MAKTQYTIRVEDNLLEKAKIISEKEIRSLNNQIEYFIAKGIADYEKEHGAIVFPVE